MAVSTAKLAAPAKTTAAPEVKEKKPRKLKKRLAYGGERDAEGHLKEKLTAVPTDYNPKIHLPPSAKDFAERAVFYDWRAQLADKTAARFRNLATQERELGDSSTRAEKKRLIKLTEKVADIKKSLLDSGVTEEQIKAILASVASNAPAA